MAICTREFSSVTCSLSIYVLTDKPLNSNAIVVEVYLNWINLHIDIYIHPYISVCRPSAIPGPIPDELVVPTTTSIGLFYVILSFKPCALYMHFQMKVISWHHLSRCEIIDENGLAPRSFHQGCTCWIFIWYVFHSQYMETKAVSYSIYGTNLPHFASSIFFPINSATPTQSAAYHLVRTREYYRHEWSVISTA